MLTPGEYVVKRSVVARLGVGFFDALNHLTLPAHQLAQRVQGFASGGLVGLASSTVPRPELDSRTSTARTVRVELVADKLEFHYQTAKAIATEAQPG